MVAAGLAAATPAWLEPRLAAAEEQAQPSIGAKGADGLWRFESTTTSGSCPSLEPRDVTIQGGHIVAANGGASQPWGYVESDGTFVARFTDASGSHVSRAVGSLKGGAGKGAWSSASDYCGGNWRAVKAGR
jgi:hypothetical protein